MSAKDENLLVAIDVGTFKTCAIIGEMAEEGLNVLGFATKVSKGITKGVVTNIEQASLCMLEALEEAEYTSNREVSSVLLSISGTHIKGSNSNGVARVRSPEVSDEDISRVLDSANAVAIPQDRQFLHVLAQEYILDGQEGIRNPRGMTGVRLEAKVHIVTGAVSCSQNLVKAANINKLQVADIVLSPLAASEAVLGEDEKEIGCVLVDMGAGTTDIAVWSKGVLVYTAVIDIAGNHITSDIQKCLGTSIPAAETLKIQSGCAMSDAVGTDEIITVPDPSGRSSRKIPKKALAEIIEPRLREIFEMVGKKIAESGLQGNLPGGVILTGGAALMDAFPELCEKTLGMPTRRGVPRNVGGDDNVQNPKFSTAVGLLLHAVNPPDIKSYSTPESKRSGLLGKIIDWIKQIV